MIKSDSRPREKDVNSRHFHAFFTRRDVNVIHVDKDRVNVT